MIATAVLAVVALAELGVLLHLVTRRSEATARERLLERDNLRLQRDLELAHDRIMFLVGKDWNVPPAETARADVNDDLDERDDEFEHFRSHDELADDLPLMLEPEPTVASL